MAQDWRKRVSDLLDRSISMTVANVNPDGAPHAADVYFVSDADLNLYFYSDPASRHSRNLLRDPRVAITVRYDSMDWHKIQGVQAGGIAERVVEPDERDAAWRMLCEKFPFYVSFTDVVAHLDMYRVRPIWIRWLDNGVSFGYKEEHRLSEH